MTDQPQKRSKGAFTFTVYIKFERGVHAHHTHFLCQIFPSKAQSDNMLLECGAQNFAKNGHFRVLAEHEKFEIAAQVKNSSQNSCS